MPCSEVQLLRRLGIDPRARRSIVERIVRKYRSGKVAAADVCDALRALRGQNLRLATEELMLGALGAVEPIPSLLWTWACTNVDFFGCGTLRTLLAVADRDPWYRKHLERDIQRWTSSVEGVVALLYESALMSWAREHASRGVDAILAPGAI